MKKIKLLICLLFLSYPLGKIWGSDSDLRRAKEHFAKCHCDSTSKKDCENALRYCEEYLKNEKDDSDKINEAKALKNNINNCLKCIESIEIQEPPIPTPPIPKVNKKSEPKLSTAEEKKQKQIKRAWDYNHNGNIQSRLENYNEAIKLYTKAIEDNPKYIYYRNRAEANMSKGDYQSAIEDIERAIERYKDYSGNEDGNGGNYTTLGEIYSKLREYQNAINSYEQAIKWYDECKKSQLTYVDNFGKPIDIPVSELKAQVYNSRGVTYFQIAYNKQREKHLMQYNLKRALEDFNEAIKLDPKNSTYKENRDKTSSLVTNEGETNTMLNTEKPTTGKIIFYSNSSVLPIDVFVNDSLIGTISDYYQSGEPRCEDKNAATVIYNGSVGEHKYWAKYKGKNHSNVGIVGQSGERTIKGGDCIRIPLDFSKKE